MRKFLTVLGYIFTIFGVILSFLPLGTIALLPLILALVVLIIAFSKSESHQKNQLKYLTIITIVCVIFVLGKTYLVKEEVVKDEEFEQQKIENKIEAKKDLKDLEALEEIEGLE